jgi:hypothetical protein
LVPQSFAAKLLGMDSPRLHRLIQARLLQTIELERRRFVGSDSLETLARSERLHRRGVNKPWTANEESLLGTASDRDIALKIGRSIKIVRARRCELGVPSFRWKRHLEWIEHGSVKRLN